MRDQQRDLIMTTSGIRTIIADDEPLAREKLRILLASEAGVQIVAECRDGRQTIAALETYKPDLLLLGDPFPHSWPTQGDQNVLRARFCPSPTLSRISPFPQHSWD